MRRSRTYALGLAAGAAAAVAVRALTEPRRTIVRRRSLRLPAWPAALDGLRMAVVGDLHAGAPHVDVERVRRVTAALARRRPELLLMAGDVVDAEVAGGTEVAPEAVATALGELAPPLGSFAVLGNHDRSFGGERVAAALRGGGLVVLENEAIALERRGTRLWLAAIADDSSASPDPDAALADVPPGEPVVVLTHSPDVFPRVPKRVTLTVAGHTHAGQVAIPGLRAWWTPSRYGARYARRHVVEDGRHLFVTSGVGTSRLPLRLGAPPEVVVLSLRARSRFSLARARASR